MITWRTGDTIGEYEIVGFVDRGGMGKVFKVRKAGLNQPLALKLIDSDGGPAEQDMLRSRFQDEARALQRLAERGCRHVVRYEGYGITGDGTPYLVTEYVDGVTLETLVKAPKLPEGSIHRIIGQLAQALDVVHQERMAHRDLKPSNAMCDRSVRGALEDSLINVTLIDFGISLTEHARRLTSSGGAPGTLPYAAVELLAGEWQHPEAIDQAQARDLFGLGLIWYELWKGRPFWSFKRGPKFVAEEAADRMKKFHSNVGTELPDCPHQAFIARLLSEKPSTRPSAKEIRDWLKEGTHRSGIPTFPPPVTRETLGGEEPPGQDVRRGIFEKNASVNSEPPPAPEGGEVIVEATRRSGRAGSNDGQVPRPPVRWARWAVAAGVTALIATGGLFLSHPSRGPQSASAADPLKRAQAVTESTPSAGSSSQTGTVASTPSAGDGVGRDPTPPPFLW